MCEATLVTEDVKLKEEKWQRREVAGMMEEVEHRRKEGKKKKREEESGGGGEESGKVMSVAKRHWARERERERSVRVIDESESLGERMKVRLGEREE